MSLSLLNLAVLLKKVAQNDRNDQKWPKVAQSGSNLDHITLKEPKNYRIRT